MVKWLSFVLVLVSVGLGAEQKKSLGQWDVHYIAFNTTFLSPEIAKANQIQRSPNNALVNISVLDRMSNQAQEVNIEGNARNLLGNTTPLTFKQVNEGDAIYYLAVMPFENEEYYRFKIELSQGTVSQTLTFEQKLYKED